MKLSACCLLMVLSLQAFGQKLNVISVSEAYQFSRLKYLYSDDPLFTGTADFSLVSSDERLLLLGKSLSDDSVYIHQWLYELDPDLLTILDSNLFFLKERVENKLNSLERLVESLELRRATRARQDQKEFCQKSIELLTKRKNQIGELIDSYDPNKHISYARPWSTDHNSMHYGGCTSQLPSCKLSVSYNKTVTKGDYTITVRYRLPESKNILQYEHHFSDKSPSMYRLSEYQMDVNTKGDLVYLRHIYSPNGYYQGTRLIHCNANNEVVYDKQLGFVANKNSFLLEFENDNTVKILGIEHHTQLVLCKGMYHLDTKKADRNREQLSTAQIIKDGKSEDKTLSGRHANNILGYKEEPNGSYIFLSKNKEAKAPYPLYYSTAALNKMELVNKQLSLVTFKNQPWRLRSTSESFYVVKLSETDTVEWVNTLDFRSMWVNDIGDGAKFPISFHTQDRKWIKNIKGAPKEISQGIGFPMMAMVTPEGIEYIEPSYDLLNRECLILTKIHQLENGEYVGFGAKIMSTEYDKFANGFYQIGVSWHVVRFEVSD